MTSVQAVAPCLLRISAALALLCCMLWMAPVGTLEVSHEPFKACKFLNPILTLLSVQTLNTALNPSSIRILNLVCAIAGHEGEENDALQPLHYLIYMDLSAASSDVPVCLAFGSEQSHRHHSQQEAVHQKASLPATQRPLALPRMEAAIRIPVPRALVKMRACEGLARLFCSSSPSFATPLTLNPENPQRDMSSQSKPY